MTAIALAPGVYRIPTAPADLLNSYLLSDDDGSLTLVDAGLWTAPRRILAALAALGKAPSDVGRIVLTHAHLDHAGGLAEIAEATRASVLSHERDAVYLRTGRAPPTNGSTRLGRLLRRLPGARFTGVEVGEQFADGTVLDVGGGLQVVHTPGHTPGHVALLHHRTGVLITGDSVVNVRGLRYPPRTFCTDFRLSEQTADRLSELDFDIAAFTHGAEIRRSARAAVRAFLHGRPR